MCAFFFFWTLQFEELKLYSAINSYVCIRCKWWIDLFSLNLLYRFFLVIQGLYFPPAWNLIRISRAILLHEFLVFLELVLSIGLSSISRLVSLFPALPLRFSPLFFLLAFVIRHHYSSVIRGKYMLGILYVLPPEKINSMQRGIDRMLLTPCIYDRAEKLSDEAEWNSRF